jgi:hypothetical protein
MYSTLPPKENKPSKLTGLRPKPKVNITYHGELMCTHRMTRKEIDLFVLHMRRKGYEIEVTYDGKC